MIAPDALLALLKEIEAEVGDAPLELETRIVEVPVLYNDPWTHETLMRFRERHQDPSSTDLEYAARINNLADVDAFIAAHSGAPDCSRGLTAMPSQHVPVKTPHWSEEVGCAFYRATALMPSSPPSRASVFTRPSTPCLAET